MQAANAAAAAAAAPQVVTLPTRINGTPHSRDLRRFFYSDASDSVLRALAAGESRITMRCTIPELNPEMDVYRVGTLLELTRELATRIAEDGRRVKVCVQGSMGQGVFQGLPLSLSGAPPPLIRLARPPVPSKQVTGDPARRGSGELRAE